MSMYVYCTDLGSLNKMTGEHYQTGGGFQGKVSQSLMLASSYKHVSTGGISFIL